MDLNLIFSLIIGVVAFELYNKFYAKGDKRKIVFGLVLGVIAFTVSLVVI